MRSATGFVAAPMPETAAALPARTALRGPITTSRLHRSSLVLAAVWCSGTALALAGSAPGLQALGLGIAAPGAGFLIGGHWLATVVVVILFAIAAAWFFMGNAIAPLFVWLFAAILAPLTAGDAWTAARWVVPLSLAAVVLLVAVVRIATVIATRRRVGDRSAYLARHASELAARVVADPCAGTRELSDDELAHLRFALDRGLQPLDEFNGLEGVGPDNRLQFFETSLRYQMCQSAWTLSHAQHVFTPAFQGYIADAQRNFVHKMLHPRAWTYWEIQNLWGYLRWREADPVATANIMYSGYFSYMLAGYLSNTRDQGFEEPGSLTFAHPDGRTYEYDVHRLIGALVENFRASPYCLFPCEPGWSYTMCNGYAVLALPAYDRLYGTDLCGEILPDYIRGYEEEFVTLDGRLPMANNARLGLTLYAIPRRTVMFDALSTWQMAAIDRPIARRTYELMREYRIGLRSGDPVDLKLNLFGDGAGLGKLVAQEPAMIYASLLAAAAEMGDTELVEQLRVDIEARFPATTEGGVKRLDGIGVWAQMFLLMALLSREGEHADRIKNGIPEALANGPTLSEAPYPDVLVAKATGDGTDLDFVLTPGREPGRFELGLRQLRPDRTYRVAQTGETVRADAAGTAVLRIELTTRTNIHLVPEI